MPPVESSPVAALCVMMKTARLKAVLSSNAETVVNSWSRVSRGRGTVPGTLRWPMVKEDANSAHEDDTIRDRCIVQTVWGEIVEEKFKRR